jgi:hypothetical protein
MPEIQQLSPPGCSGSLANSAAPATVVIVFAYLTGFTMKLQSTYPGFGILMPSGVLVFFSFYGTQYL